MTSFSLNPVPPAETLLESDADVCAAAERVAAAFEARPFESDPEGRIVAVTWNVWFAPTAFDQRLRALVLEVLEVAPDLVGLQEVTPRFEAALRGCKPLRMAYHFSPFSVGQYGCLVLVRRTLPVLFTQVKLPTEMDRSLVAAAISARSSSSSAPRDLPVLIFATVHLESRNAPETRRKQLRAIRTFFDASEYCGAAKILCGDFNFDDRQSWGDWQRQAPLLPKSQLENRCLEKILPSMIDCWEFLRRKDERGEEREGGEDEDEDGATFSGRSNACCVDDAGEVMRYDRFLFAPPSAPSACIPASQRAAGGRKRREAGAEGEAGGGGEEEEEEASSCCVPWSIRRMGTEPFPLAPRGGRCYHAESRYPQREVKEVEPGCGGGAFSSPSNRRALMKASDHYGLCLEVTGVLTN